jgi:hypothetical protein
MSTATIQISQDAAAAGTTPAGFPAHLYHCLLDEQPHYLVPAQALHWREPADLIVNPRCWFSWHGALPPDKVVRVAFSEYFCPSDWVVWVDDPATNIIWPFWVGYEYIEYLGQMIPGYPVPIHLPDHVVQVFRETGILVELNHEAARRQQWLRTVQTATTQFTRGYATLTGLIHPFHIGALRRYFRFHTRMGSFPFGDEQVARRFTAYNDAVARFLHFQLAPIVSDITADVVRPADAWFLAYQSESELPRHTDHDSFEYSISLNVDASPEPQGQNPWPIDLQTPEGMLRIWQNIGDALLYRGRYLPHSRDRLPRGYTSSSILLHYASGDNTRSMQ